jgi:hypothetical protein
MFLKLKHAINITKFPDKEDYENGIKLFVNQKEILPDTELRIYKDDVIEVKTEHGTLCMVAERIKTDFEIPDMGTANIVFGTLVYQGNALGWLKSPCRLVSWNAEFSEDDMMFEEYFIEDEPDTKKVFKGLKVVWINKKSDFEIEREFWEKEIVRLRNELQWATESLERIIRTDGTDPFAAPKNNWVNDALRGIKPELND